MAVQRAYSVVSAAGTTNDPSGAYDVPGPFAAVLHADSLYPLRLSPVPAGSVTDVPYPGGVIVGASPDPPFLSNVIE